MKERMETRERVLRNLVSDPIPTIEAIAKVEGSVWIGQQEALNRETAGAGEYATSLPNAIERAQAGNPAVINGNDGRRWIVESDGSVAFSKSHAQESPEHTAMARELGFEIVP